MDCSPSGSSVHGIVRGIFRVRILECIAMPFSRGSSRPRDWTRISCIAGRVSIVGASREAGLTVLPWTDRTPDLAVLPAHKTASKPDSLRSKMFTAMTITLNTSHLGCTGKTQFHLLFYFHFLPFSSRRWKAIVAERVGLLFCFCAAMRYLKIVFEREKKIPRKNLLLLKTLGFSCDNMWHESI